MFEIYFDLTVINLLIPTAISGAACGQQMEVWSCATLWPVSLIYCQKSERECQKHLIFSFFLLLPNGLFVCLFLNSRRVAQCKVVVVLNHIVSVFFWGLQVANPISHMHLWGLHSNKQPKVSFRKEFEQQCYQLVQIAEPTRPIWHSTGWLKYSICWL